MRRQHFAWTFLVLSLVLSIYGTYSLIYSSSHNKEVPVLGLLFFIIGLILLTTFLVLYAISMYQKNINAKKMKEMSEARKVEDKSEPIKEIKEPEPAKVEEVAKEEIKSTPTNNYHRDKEVTYAPRRNNSRYDRDVISGYVRKVGYGPVLRVTGNEILDMRTNSYYMIQGDIVHLNGSGPAFEISGNRVRLVYGSYLYEISGDNVNKVFGGYYASFSGSYLQTYDLSDKYEVPFGLNLKTRLAIVAILFGSY